MQLAKIDFFKDRSNNLRGQNIPRVFNKKVRQLANNSDLYNKD